MKNKAVTLAIMSVVAFLVSCTKYDEGGNTNRAKNKICNNVWVNEISPINDSIVLLTYDFSKDGTLSIEAVTNEKSYTYSSTWELREDDTKIEISSIEYEIEKLTKDAFWYSHTTNPVIVADDINPNGSISENSIESITIMEKFKKYE